MKYLSKIISYDTLLGIKKSVLGLKPARVISILGAFFSSWQVSLILLGFFYLLIFSVFLVIYLIFCIIFYLIKWFTLDKTI